MEINGLNRHPDLQQYLNDIEHRLSEFENGKCSFEKVAINFRWCIEYILREFQKEYPNCASGDTFNTIKNLQDLNVIDRSAAAVLHQVRKVGNRGGAHLTEDKADAGEIRQVFDALVSYIPQFLSFFPEPSKKKLSTTSTAVRIDNLELANEQMRKGDDHRSLFYTRIDGHPADTAKADEEDGCTYYSIPTTNMAERTVDKYTETNGALYYNTTGITKAARAVVEELKRNKADNSYAMIPAAAQQGLGFSGIAYCCVTENDGYRSRSKRFFDHARPNKFDYFNELASLTQTLTIPPCFSEDAFDEVKEVWYGDLDSAPFIEVIKRSWNDLLKEYPYNDLNNAPQYPYVKKLILPDNLEPACLSWLNMFTELEELVVPPTMYVKDGVVYRKMGNQVLAVLRNRVTDHQELELGSYTYPDAEWGSEYMICTFNGKRFLRSEKQRQIECDQASINAPFKFTVLSNEEIAELRRKAQEKAPTQSQKAAKSEPAAPIQNTPVQNTTKPLFSNTPFKVTVLSDEEIAELRRKAQEKNQKQ